MLCDGLFCLLLELFVWLFTLCCFGLILLVSLFDLWLLVFDVWLWFDFFGLGWFERALVFGFVGFCGSVIFRLILFVMLFAF